jgi:hypothetical protein
MRLQQGQNLLAEIDLHVGCGSDDRNPRLFALENSADETGSQESGNR